MDRPRLSDFSPEECRQLFNTAVLYCGHWHDDEGPLRSTAHLAKSLNASPRKPAEDASQAFKNLRRFLDAFSAACSRRSDVINAAAACVSKESVKPNGDMKKSAVTFESLIITMNPLEKVPRPRDETGTEQDLEEIRPSEELLTMPLDMLQAYASAGGSASRYRSKLRPATRN